MALFLERIDSAPIINAGFDAEFTQWIWVLVDTLNEVINDIEGAFKVLYAPDFTAAEITAMTASLRNGVLLYDSTNDVYVGMQGGSLVKFTTTAYP